MANVLATEKQVAIISALAEGSAIRQIERMTGGHRDTIMRLDSPEAAVRAAIIQEYRNAQTDEI